MSSAMLIALLTFATGCAQHGVNTQDASSTDSGDHPAHPIDGLDPIPLSAFREMRRTSIPQAIEPQSLLLDERHGQALILDQEAATVWATDSLYLHDPRPACINHTEVRASVSLPDGDGACPDGTAKVARGQLHTPLPPAAIAAVPASGHVAVLDSGGQLHWITTDSTQSTSFNFMRPQEGPTLAVEISDASTVHLNITHNEIGVAIDNTLHIFDMAGTPTTQWEHGETIHSIDHHDDAWWTTTTNTTHRDGREAGPGGMMLVKSTNTIWVLTETELVPLNSDDAPFNVSQPTGQAVFWGDRMLYTTADGIMESLPDGALRQCEGVIVDMQTNSARELVALQSDGTLRVFVDETAYSADHQLHVWGSTFIESPRKSHTHIACDGPADSIHAIHNQAKTNLNLLHDLPADFSLGVTPAHWRRARQCGAIAPLKRLSTHLDLGVLFHEAPVECEGSQDCYETALQADLDSFSEPLHWVSGLGSHTDLGVDWVQALQHIGAPHQYAFFGMSLRPDVVHDDDIRAKDSWPIAVHDHTRAWAADSVSEILDRKSEGWLRIFPGNNIPIFNLGGCANLFLNECHPLGRGGGSDVGAADIESLNLLLHRAIMGAQNDGVHTWNFHLPDIGEYDYTDGCTEEKGRWFGVECEGARIQNWLFDVHLRFVDKDLIQWALPRQLVQP